jgi:hypothetical protein
MELVTIAAYGHPTESADEFESAAVDYCLQNGDFGY